VADQSELDRRYFVTGDTYNCPYCNRHSVTFSVERIEAFDWTNSKTALAVYVKCGGEKCGKVSLHLTFETGLVAFVETPWGSQKHRWHQKANIDKLDAYFFYHQPTSFFTIDDRIPPKIRELVSEADGCRRFNYLTGASACLRKAIYELLSHEGVAKTESDGRGGERERHYQDRVKDLKSTRKNMDPGSVDILAAALRATSDHLHEDSWAGWTREEFDAIDEAVRAVLREMYVLPDERKSMQQRAGELVQKLTEARAKKALPEEKPR